MSAGPSRPVRYNYRLPDAFDHLIFEDQEDRPYQSPPEIVLETKVCQAWQLGRCDKGEKCRFRHKLNREQNHLVHEYEHTSISQNKKTLLPSTNIDSRTRDDYSESDTRSVPNNRTEFSQEDAALIFLAAMTLSNLEKIRQAMFSGGASQEHNESTTVDIQKKLVEKFHRLGNARREEQAMGNNKDEKASENTKKEVTKIWVEEEEKESETNVEKMVEALGRQRQQQSLSNEDTGAGKRKSNTIRDKQVDIQSANFTSTTSQIIVLESNLVTCGAGLEIHRITPGYDLCRVSLQLPIETTGTEVVEMFLEGGLETSDFHILRIDEVDGKLRAIVLTDIRSGIVLEKIWDTFFNEIAFEIRREAVWTSRAMEYEFKPSLEVSWDSSISSDSEELLGAMYDGLFELEGVQMESCTLLSSESTADRVVLTVDFDSLESATKARNNISDQLWSWSLIQTLEVRMTTKHHRSLVIPMMQYEAQKGLWLGLTDTEDDERQIETKTIEDGVKIQIQGENEALIGALKVRIEKLARGEMLDGDYWHPSFSSSEDSVDFFNDVMKKTDSYLECRPDIHTLVVYGELGGIKEARKVIQEEVHKREEVVTKTVLMEPSISFFNNGGIQKLKNLVGYDNIDMKSTPSWSAIMMKGGETATHHLRRLIKESLVQENTLFPGPTNPVICPVCFEEQQHPELIDCGHGYCSECLNNLLISAANNQAFPIVCLGEEATCNVPISLPFIRRFLPHHVFGILMEAAFVTYLERNPTQFRYCKTPDCRQTYRQQPANEAAIITCPACSARTCSSCSEYHENMTCAEYRILNDPDEQERLNNELADNSGYKKCPRCAVWVEKMGGCNHMSCRCGSHICWTCMGTFEYHEIYDHMNAHHGGILDPIEVNGFA